MKKFSSTVKGSLHRTSRIKLVINILAIGLVAVVSLYFLPGFMARVSSLVLTPVIVFETWLSESNSTVPSYFRDRQLLLTEIDNLKMEMSQRGEPSDSQKRLEYENQELKAILGVNDEERIAARVIGRPSALPYDVIVLDRGEVDGVLANTPVFVGKEQVIGFVSAVFPRTSLVTLVTTPGFTSTVYIYGPNIYTKAVGQGAGALRVNVPQGIDLSEGNLVALPALASGIYGEISVIESVPSRPEQFGYVTIDRPISGLHYVSIGKRALEEISFDDAKAVVDSIRKDLFDVDVPSGVLVDVAGTSTATSTDNTDTTP